MLKARLLTAFIALPLFMGALFYLPRSGWALFLAPWLLIGAWEWSTLAKWSAVSGAIYVVLVGVLSAVIWSQIVTPEYIEGAILLYAIALVFWLVIAPLWLMRGWRVRNPLLLALTGLVLLLPLWMALVLLQARPGIVLMLMIIIWISDTAAFICGKCWGKRKLAPSISPGKTWEGVFGALIGVALYYVIITVGFPTGYSVFSGVTGLAVFLALTILGVEGDLFESWIKRTADVKDSGTILPGHGGILDRVDALTSSLPAAAVLLAWFA